MADGGVADEVYAEILGALDADGAVINWLQFADALAPLAGLVPVAAQAAGAAEQIRLTLATAVKAHRVLSPRGWGITNVSITTLATAIALDEAGDPAAADEVLARYWDRRHLDFVVKRVKDIGGSDPNLGAIGRERWRLLRKAEDHHIQSRYEASVPIVLAQIEGIIADVHEGKTFFSRAAHRRAGVLDPSRLAGVRSGLEAVRQVFTQSVETSAAEGRLSRHGILHGRELGYDTEVISAKCWSLLDVVVEWAIPVGGGLAQSRRTAAFAERAGSEAVDERGRRMDRREFAETESVLNLLVNSQMGWHRQRGAFRSDLVPGVYSTEDFTKRGLPEDHGVRAIVMSGGQVFWAWRRTVTGWVLADGLVAEAGNFAECNFAEWWYGAPEPPSGPPPDGAGWVGGAGVHPDWIGS